MTLHEKYMMRCLSVAEKGPGKVAANPMVGCVIVHNDKVIGEGYHKKFGESHAEVNAINSVKDKLLLKNCTLYVNLEPCSHYGKTPPCVDLIIRYKIKYVVIGKMDPNPMVCGKGIHKLMSAGCDIKVGVLEQDCQELNKRFYTFYQQKRPYIILKWAQTANGYMGINNQKVKISGKDTDKLVHKWRGREQAIMVGTNTALIDNPKLTVRNVKGENPLRIVIDKALKIPSKHNLLDGSTPTIVFTSKNKAGNKNVKFEKINFKKDILKQVVNKLYEINVQSVLIEGGTKLLESFINKNLWDEAAVIHSNKKVFQTSNSNIIVRAPILKGKLNSVVNKKNDKILFYTNIM